MWRNGLAHTAVHNTVTVDRQDQMKMVSRFTWTNWAKGKVLHHDEKTWWGEHDGYRRLSAPVTHKRTVLSLPGDRWLIVDHLHGNQNHHYVLHWLLADFPYQQINFGVQELALVDSSLSDSKILVQMGLLDGNPHFSIIRADPNSTRGWRSRYYGEKEPSLSAMLETDQPRVCFWTFFGFEQDIVQIEGEILNILSPQLKTSINLQSLIPNY
jgi:hypothetical protein